MNPYYYCLNVKANDYVWLLQNKALEITEAAIEEIENGFIIRTEEPIEPIKRRLSAYAEELSVIVGAGIELKFSTTKCRNEDWIAQYRESVQPIECGKYYIHPSWCEQRGDKVNVIIEPALAFGSGHHPSTFGCLMAFQVLEQRFQGKDSKNNLAAGLKSKRILDVGCGSGILSICAKKSGAIVFAGDTDERAVESTKENAQKNDVVLDGVFCGSLDAIPEEKYSFDVVVANILADVILALPLEEFVKERGYLILSGILEVYLPKVLAKFKDFNVISREINAQWATLVLEKKDRDAK